MRVAGVGEEVPVGGLQRGSLWLHVGKEQGGREVGKLRGKGREEPGAAGLMVPFLPERSHTPLHE